MTTRSKKAYMAVDEGSGSQMLLDAPPVYLTEKYHWQDFKKAINECGLAWALPDWMTTIVYQGTEWKEIATKKSVNLDEFFPKVQKKQAADGVDAKSSDLSTKLVGLLDFPKNISQYIQPTLLFCNLRTVEYESEKKLPARQKMWAWVLKCLRGPRSIPGQYYYLVDEVTPYDISYLFKRLCQVLEQVTICSLDDELEAVIKVEFNPQAQNIFRLLLTYEGLSSVFTT